eukprot:8777204-Prorocentrum_lima.AAC.1
MYPDTDIESDDAELNDDELETTHMHRQKPANICVKPICRLSDVGATPPDDVHVDNASPPDADQASA